MLLALTLAHGGFAHAGTLGLEAGAGIGQSYDQGAMWYTASPTLAVTYGWHPGVFDIWIGSFGSALYAHSGNGKVPAAAFMAETGLGFGKHTFSAGGYCGIGYPSSEIGAYARVNAGGVGWARAFGGEARIFTIPAYNTVATAVMFRVEVGPRPERVAPPPPDEPAPLYHADPYDT